jgi:hypothetical protein
MLRRDGIDNAEPNAHPTLKQWSYETGRPVSGLIRKALSHNHKTRNPIHRRRSASGGTMSLPTQRLFIGRARTVVGTLMISLVLVMTTGSRFSGDRTSYRSFQASKRLRGPCPSFVCFGASWPVDCCTCSREQVALSVSAPAHHCHAWNRGYCGHGFEAARAG